MSETHRPTHQIQERKRECDGRGVGVPVFIPLPIVLGPDGEKGSDDGPEQKPDRKCNAGRKLILIKM